MLLVGLLLLVDLLLLVSLSLLRGHAHIAGQSLLAGGSTATGGSTAAGGSVSASRGRTCRWWVSNLRLSAVGREWRMATRYRVQRSERFQDDCVGGVEVVLD
ncbi:hypothetical protein EJ04DRAFT_523806 [Polyplosphaeria fusca]|uniref:Secreted protein n=1 Tax=Polyplosphaeria fusca TaxID=682080 RepID=A0A9P4QUR1_9PLEO|nr:hypothetical protein EJ04DRAFT_523806 [Polyplosphaeria fusca]